MSDFNFLTYCRETCSLFSYVEIGELANEPSNKIDRVGKFDNLAVSRMLNDQYFSSYDFLNFLF